MSIISRGKAAGLTLGLGSNSLVGHLGYIDYEANTWTSYSQSSVLPFNNRDTTFNDFTSQFINQLAEKAEWQIKDEGAFITPLLNLGVGIDQVVLNQLHPDGFRPDQGSQSLIPISSYQDISKKGPDYYRLLTKNALNRSLVIVNLNFFNAQIQIFKRKEASKRFFWLNKEIDLSFRSPEDKFKQLLSPDLRRYLASSSSEDLFYNRLMNYLAAPYLTTQDAQYQDMIRSVFTYLLSMVQSKMNLKDLGFYGKQAQYVDYDYPLVILTGEVPYFFKDFAYNYLVLADGLQLGGIYYLYLDDNLEFRPWLNLDLTEFISTWPLLFNKPFKLVIANDRSFRITQDLLFKLWDKDRIESSKVAIKNNIWHYDLKDCQELRFLNVFSDGVIDKRAVEAVLSPRMRNQPQESKMVTEKGQDNQSDLDSRDIFSSLVVDLREIPIPYGPRPVNNISNIKRWLKGLKRML